jgi:peptidoglycan/LPS O-acetylase OafA/YrhL
LQSNSQPYLTTLTPLRGIAALIIVIYHSSIDITPFIPNGYTCFLDNAWLWVDFFFILSGFILCFAYGRYFKENIDKSVYKKYIGARFARVYPLHFITTIWVFICAVIIVHFTAHMSPFIAEAINPKALPACLLLIQSMHIYFLTPLNSPSWSLSTEWWVYMIFPFFVPFFFRLGNKGKILIGVAIIIFYIFLRYVLGPLNVSPHPTPTMNITANFGFFRCLAGFFTGMLLYTFYEHCSGFRIIKRDWFFFTVFLGMVAAMHFGVMDIIIIAFFPFILIAAAYNQTLVKRFLDTKVLQRLGDWSFSIYLVHTPIIFTFYAIQVLQNHKLLDDTVKATVQKPDYIVGMYICIALVILTLLIAPLFYRFVEIPSRNYFNKVFETKHKHINPESTEV